MVIPSIDAVIEVLEIKGNTVRLGIKAPRHVSVVREELLQKMEAEIPSIDDDNSVLV